MKGIDYLLVSQAFPKLVPKLVNAPEVAISAHSIKTQEHFGKNDKNLLNHTVAFDLQSGLRFLICWASLCDAFVDVPLRRIGQRSWIPPC